MTESPRRIVRESDGSTRPKPAESTRWTVAQLGAREHYSVPRAFKAANELRNLYTDTWCRWGAGIIKHGPGPLRSIAGRFHQGIPSSSVTSASIQSTFWHLTRRLVRRPQSIRDVYQWDLEYGDWFDRRVAKILRRQEFDPDCDRFFGFATTCLQSLKVMRDAGALTVVDQPAAGRIEERLVLEEVEAWPGWASAAQSVPEVFYDRLRAEWTAADCVLVNSEWSRRGLVAEGVDPGKIIVVPCVFEPEMHASATGDKPHRHGARPLRLLFLGRVTLGKGIQYLIEAARRMPPALVDIFIVGPLGISETAVRSAPANVRFIGQVPRGQTVAWFEQADVFVFPTLSDGFGLTQLEAMSHGLPVIATPNCGSVVVDGVNGMIVPIRDPEAIVQAVVRLNDDRELRGRMSAAARVRSAQFTLDEFDQNLNYQVDRLRDSTAKSAEDR